MNKEDMLNVIEYFRESRTDVVELLNLTWIHVFINQIPDEEFERYMEETERICSE